MTRRDPGFPWALGLWLAGVALCGWVIAFRTDVVFELTRFLPRDDPTVLLLDELQASQSARLILIGIDGGSAPQRAEASTRLADALRQSGLFSRIENGSDLLRREEAKALFEDRYLLSPTSTADRFTETGLRAELQERLNDLRSPMSVVEKQLLPRDPTGELQSLLRLWLADRQQPQSRGGVWVSPDGRRAVLLAESRATSLDAAGQRAALDAISRSFAVVRGDAALSLQLGGPAPLTLDSQERIRADVERLSTAATVLIIVLLIVAYRSLRAVILSLLPVVSAILAGCAVTSVLFGYVHGITLGFAITLLGVAVDYPITLMSFVRGDQPVRDRLRQIAPLQGLCVILTSIGYLSLISPTFPALSQLAVFSATGLVVAMLVTRRVLPALLPERWGFRGRIPEWRWLRKMVRPSARWSRLVGFAVGAIVLALLIINPPRWEDDIAAISPVPRTMMETDQQLRNALGAPEAGHLIVIHGTDAQDVLTKSEALVGGLQGLRMRSRLQGFTAPSHYLPSDAVQRQRQAALPEPAPLRAAIEAAARGLAFQPGLFEPFLADVERARTGPLVSRDDLLPTPVGSVIGSLLFPRTGGWTGLVSLTGVNEPDEIAAVVQSLPIDGVRYLAVRQETNRLLNAVRADALRQLAIGAGAIVVTLIIGLRSGRRISAVLLPVCLALLLDLAALTALGQRLSLLHLVSLILVAGIAIDYGIFFSQTEDDVEFAARALHAMLMCCATTLLTFGLLALSSLPILQAIGTTVAIGVATTFLLAFYLARPAAADAVNAAESASAAGRRGIRLLSALRRRAAEGSPPHRPGQRG